MREARERGGPRRVQLPWAAQYIGFHSMGGQSSDTKTPNYPPNNLIRLTDGTYRIEIAVAGFADDEVKIDLKGQKLSVTGSRTFAEDVEFIHRGISYRDFTLDYNLAEGVEVTSADMDCGLLTIKLKSVVAKETVTSIPINSKTQLNG